MSRVSRYLLGIFFQSFLSLFLTLFFLVTVITFIRVSKLTSLFSVSFMDLFEMYLYLLPEITTYILPVTFFIALTVAMFRLSKDNEIIVLFAMSLSPKRVSKLFFFFSLFISSLLLINAIFFVPISTQLGKNFLEYKKMEANVNIKSSEFGQKFSSWNLFADEADGENRYIDIVLYERDDMEDIDTFIISSSATVDKNSSLLELNLNSGSTYSIRDQNIKRIDYERLKITYSPDTNNIKSDAIFEYWSYAKVDKKRAKQLSFAILVAFFPLVTYLFAISFGVVNLRHQSTNIYLNMFLVIIIFYILSYQVATKIPFVGTGVLLTLFYLASIYTFYKKILVRY